MHLRWKNKAGRWWEVIEHTARSQQREHPVSGLRRDTTGGRRGKHGGAVPAAVEDRQHSFRRLAEPAECEAPAGIDANLERLSVTPQLEQT